MSRVKNVIIGFGKAGKTLAADLGNRGETTVLIEKDSKMYGGTCINVACIPSKKLADLAKKKPDNVDNAEYYTKSIQEKKELIAKLNEANYLNVQETENVEVINGEASFISQNEVHVKLNNGEEITYKAERIFVNTGSTPNIPPIDGLEVDGKIIHTSETLMDDEEFPEKLTIIGDGFIGLEFASIYRQFGSKVQVISNSDRDEFIKAIDYDVAKVVLEALENMGIEFMFKANTKKITNDTDSLTLTYDQESHTEEIQTNKVLVAVGRRPNVEGLNLEAADVALNEDGSIQVNKHLETTANNIYAMGDVKGGAQHTYISLDDYRIVMSDLFDDGSYNLSERNNVPTATFINPPLSTVGLSEELARGNGYDLKVATLPVESIPKAKLLGNTTGVYKAVIDADTDLILGTILFGEESHEVINIISTAMKAELPYTVLANQVFTHPTMAEALNDLYGNIE
jgi:pyruvate/2-oxoglutarate dehydrogenase complex dihydrolipoamide dehydrogenase (E3) component